MTASSGNFEDAFQMVLAFHFFEIEVVGFLRTEECAAVEFEGWDDDVVLALSKSW